ncbi:ATP-dependent DNA helicase [Trichonephila clavipes]|nr:ATP-dependent DNA helicase [Trichonephila clavipes]
MRFCKITVPNVVGYLKIKDEQPDFDIVEITRKISIDMLNTVEMTNQEAAWYLLRQPMSKSSVLIVYIPMVWPIERQRIRRTRKIIGGNELIPAFAFRNEELLSDMKFIRRHDDNEQLILERRNVFESNLDIQKTLQIIKDLCREEDLDDNAELQDVANRFLDPHPFQNLYQVNSAMSNDIRLATLNKLGAIAKKRQNLMDNARFYQLVRMANVKQRRPLTTLLLAQIDSRLKQITGNFDTNFGGLDVILIGDLRQLSPVRATPIYKQIKQRIAGPTLWSRLKFHELNEVMRQTNQMFASLLTKIGNGLPLDDDEQQLIESRFYLKQEADRLSPNGIRLFLRNVSVDEYKRSVLDLAENKIVSIATEIFEGCRNAQQEVYVRQKLHKMSVIDTGGLPYEVTLVLNKSYIRITNIDISDGLAYGAVGKVCRIDVSDDGTAIRVWLEFPESPKTGQKWRRKVSAYAKQHNISRTAVPITRRTSTVKINNNKTNFC